MKPLATAIRAPPDRSSSFAKVDLRLCSKQLRKGPSGGTPLIKSVFFKVASKEVWGWGGVGGGDVLVLDRKLRDMSLMSLSATFPHR